jgi:hypothetical protein
MNRRPHAKTRDRWFLGPLVGHDLRASGAADYRDCGYRGRPYDDRRT